MKKTLLFTPAQAGRASEDIALQIEAAILNSQIKQGESLPSERDMQIQFGTGRGVIREALRTLKQKGLIEIRKGAKGGAYVKQVEVSTVSETLSLFLKQKHISPEALIEFRESIDRTITILAVSHADVGEKAELVAITNSFAAMAAEQEPDMSSLGELDRQLNIKLAQMSGNPIFEWVMQALQLGFSSHDYHLYDNASYRMETARNWQDTAREIAAGNPSRALVFISHHYLLLQRCLDEKYMEKDIQTSE